MSYALSRYQSLRTETASPLQVLLQLYGGALRFLRQSREAIGRKDLESKAKALNGAYAIVNELMATLNTQHAPELCGNLQGLYDFVMRRIVEANRQCDVAAVDDAVRVMSELQGAWQQIAAGER